MNQTILSKKRTTVETGKDGKTSIPIDILMLFWWSSEVTDRNSPPPLVVTRLRESYQKLTRSSSKKPIRNMVISINDQPQKCHQTTKIKVKWKPRNFEQDHQLQPKRRELLDRKVVDHHKWKPRNDWWSS